VPCCSIQWRLAHLLVWFRRVRAGLVVRHLTRWRWARCTFVSFNTLAWACWPIRVVLGEPSSVVVIKEGMV
jgi:hypothetical protein